MRLNKDDVNGILLPMVPPPLPKRFCVYTSGLVEAACFVLLLLPSKIIQAWGAKLTILLLIGVYPSHFYHAFSAKAQEEIQIKGPKSLLYTRIVIQLLFIYWASWFVKT